MTVPCTKSLKNPLNLENPLIMGVLNVTPDSFYDGGNYFNAEKAIAQGVKLYQDGADLIDIGGESTRPGSDPVQEKDEIERVIPVIRALRKEVPIPLSIDTMKPKVAEAALLEGASLINDVSGFRDPDMIKVAAQANVPLCLMHMKGIPKTMQLDPYYEDGIINHLLSWFKEKTLQLLDAGIKESHIILDPGIGFGKTIDDNLKILHNLQKFRAMGYPVLVGLSRKSFMSKIIGKPSSETLSTTIAMNTVALMNGASIIRVHDVSEHCDVLKVITRFLKNDSVSVTGSRA